MSVEISKRGRPSLDPGSGPSDPVSVRFPDDLRLELQRRAARELMPVSEYVRRALAEKFLKDDATK
jgi:hypothetical protein